MIPKLTDCKSKILIIALFSATNLNADNFSTNFYNNHGSIGLINIPSARFYDEGVHGITAYDGTPDQKVTLTSNPYDWFEASFFYTNIQELPYPGYSYQDYKDKGFNLKLRLKKQGNLPAIAIGLNDFAGTGFYSSEYIVSSYGIGNIDLHLGLGWGRLNGSKKNNVKNPFGYIDDSFYNRPLGYEGKGGTFNTGQYFSGATATSFYGISYRLTNKLFISLEKDPIVVSAGGIPYPKKEEEYSYGLNYSITDNFSIGASYERGSYFSLKFIYKNDPQSSRKNYEYQTAKTNEADNKYTQLIKNLEENGIGVNKITETSRAIGLELTQFMHSDLALVEQIIKQSSRDAGINKNIKKDIKVSSLNAYSEIDDFFKKNAETIYERDTSRAFNTYTGIRFRPFIASREEFFKGALLLENDSEFVLKENLFFNTNLKYSLANNFDDLRFPPVDTFPAQVRSDIKQYLKNMDKGILIGRAQLDYHLTPKKNHHFMFTGGILEDMFSGYGVEYLYFKQNTNYAFGLEFFNVRKRDYDWGFGHLDYKNNIVTANYFYRNYGSIPFDMRISAGEYLAGDIGSTIEFSRTFRSGVRFGVFATFTDVSVERFGEGSFDKGIFFNIPIYGNLINYTWKPLTKDPGATLIRRNNLYNLLVKMRPIN
jgi:hypothetical protein